MYDWSRTPTLNHGRSKKFQLLLKECTIEADVFGPIICYFRFQLLLKECTIEASKSFSLPLSLSVSVVIERMYDWSWTEAPFTQGVKAFQLLLKECTIEAEALFRLSYAWGVSVVIERMYDWSSETNWLKINDFWQLVSGLFFENGRSAQKVPLFSKIWGDCLTVFDSCGNI